MKLVKFYNYEHDPIWVNPDRVAWVSWETSDDIRVNIWFSAQEAVIVVGPLSAVVKALTD